MHNGYETKACVDIYVCRECVVIFRWAVCGVSCGQFPWHCSRARLRLKSILFAATARPFRLLLSPPSFYLFFHCHSSPSLSTPVFISFSPPPPPPLLSLNSHLCSSLPLIFSFLCLSALLKHSPLLSHTFLFAHSAGQNAFVGLGFEDRGDAFDFNVSLQDHFKSVCEEQISTLSNRVVWPQNVVHFGLRWCVGMCNITIHYLKHAPAIMHGWCTKQNATNSNYKGK